MRAEQILCILHEASSNAPFYMYYFDNVNYSRSFHEAQWRKRQYHVRISCMRVLSNFFTD